MKRVPCLSLLALLAGCATAPPAEPGPDTHAQVNAEETPGKPGSIEATAEHPLESGGSFRGYAIVLRSEAGTVSSATADPAVFSDLSPGLYDVAVGTFEDPVGFTQVRVRAGWHYKVNFRIVDAPKAPPTPLILTSLTQFAQLIAIVIWVPALIVVFALGNTPHY